MTMYEPPFDGKPCPMCPSAIRNLSAVVHNFCGRYLEGGYSTCELLGKLWEVRNAVDQCAALISMASPPQLRDLWTAANATVIVWDQWQARAATSAEVTAQVRAMRDASVAARPLSDAHFADRMHSHGEINRRTNHA